MASLIRIGLIADTHGLLRPAALEFLKGSQMIIHCGDICEAAVLRELSCIAPVRAVRGNNDRGPWADELPESEIVRAGDVAIYVIHDISQIDIDPAAAGVRVVLSGHSHRPSIARRGGIWYVNPGSAGPRRFTLPVCAAELMIADGEIVPGIVNLQSGARLLDSQLRA